VIARCRGVVKGRIPGRPGLRQSRDVRVLRSREHRLRDPAASQPCRRDRLPAEAPGSGDRRTRCAATTPASPIGRRAGTRRAASWPRSRGTPASSTRASALSSPTWRGRPSAVAFYNQHGTRAVRAIKMGTAVTPHFRSRRRWPPAPVAGLHPRQRYADAGAA
jgi:hypothetical protein